MRNSDPDAALYWLARMLEAGEDPLYIARRLVRFASEDVGMADPQALTVAVAAKDAAHFLGMPEGNTALAQAAVYLATAPKSNAIYLAYGRAADDARNGPTEPVPLHLRNAPTKLMKDLDYGRGYEYAHDAPDAVTGMTSPAGLARRTGGTTSRPSADSRRRSSGGWTGGRRSKKADGGTESEVPFAPGFDDQRFRRQRVPRSVVRARSTYWTLRSAGEASARRGSSWVQSAVPAPCGTSRGARGRMNEKR